MVTFMRQAFHQHEIDGNLVSETWKRWNKPYLDVNDIALPVDTHVRGQGNGT